MLLSKTCFCVFLCFLVFATAIGAQGLHNHCCEFSLFCIIFLNTEQQKDESEGNPVSVDEEETQEYPENEQFDVQQEGDTDPEPNDGDEPEDGSSLADSDSSEDDKAHGNIRPLL